MNLRKTSFFSLASVLLLGAVACSNDNLLSEPDNQPLAYDKSYFANIAITNVDDLTRADNPTEDNSKDREDYDTIYDGTNYPRYDYGKDYENQINSIYLVFYDSIGNRVSTTQVRRDENFAGTDYNTGKTIYEGVVQIDVKHGSYRPAYVMCFINPITSSNFDINPDFETLESLQATTRTRIIDDNGNFAMSKSVYFGHDRVNNKDNEKIVATPLDIKSNLFETEAAAKDALDKHENIVDIYVERYAAKVDLSIAQNATAKDIVLDNDYTLEFTPEYWAVNAYESTNYICKSFLSLDMSSPLTYETLDKAMDWAWNNPGAHRCYWAQSPAYYAQFYPRVADDITDPVDPSRQFALGYYSYEQMKTNANGNLNAKARKLDGKETYNAIYARENTIAGSALRNANADPNASPKAAVASAVIVGTYELKHKGSKVNTEMFYVMGNKTNGYTVFENTDAAICHLLRTANILNLTSVDNGDADGFFDYNEEKFLIDSYKKCFVMVHPFRAAREGLVIDSRFVTIQLNPDNDYEATPLYVYLDGKYEQITKQNQDLIDRVNKQLLYAAGTVQGYNGGKVFYNIPIKHLGFYRKGNVNAGLAGTESTFKWDQVATGDFGLVRNHSYTISVNSITGLGNGIPDPNVPIVPPTDPEEYFIGARIIVLNWAVVPTQNVDL